LLQRAPHIGLVSDGFDTRRQNEETREPVMSGLLDDISRKRNVRALEQCIKAHHGTLVGWLTKKLGNVSDAADVAQDVYMRVYRFASVERIDNPQALLFKTAANLAINELKRRGRVLSRHVQVEEEDVADTVAALPCEDPTPEEALGYKQDADAMVQAIRQLPEKARSAFVKNRFEGKTYSDIAEELCVSESTVEKYMMDALKRLRARLVGKTNSTGLPLPRKARRGKV